MEVDEQLPCGPTHVKSALSRRNNSSK